MIRLGSKVRDKVTGMEGIAIGETRWLSGCLRYMVQAPMTKDGKRPELDGFDEHMLDILEQPEVTGIHPIGASEAIENEAPRPPTDAPGGPQPNVSQY